MDKKKITVIITDLDNTLFDWVDIWYSSFNAMLNRLVQDSGIPQQTLEKEFKDIHQRRGTSEYAFSIEELPSLQAKHPGQDLTKIYASAIQAYREARKASLRLYPCALETLKALKQKGCLIVGYTESMAFYTNYRIRKLGLDGVLHYIYSPADHDLPAGLTPEQIRSYPEQHYKLWHTIHRHTPNGEVKPNPAVLLDIIKDVGASVEETIYVGDSLMKDVLMAQAASVTDVYAKYGAAKDRPEYELLRRVTHWPDTAVQRERVLTESDVTPHYVLEKHICELLDLFYFPRFAEPRKNVPEKPLEVIVDLWKKTIEVQMHFNDLELRIRNYAVTILVAVLGTAAFALKESITVDFFGLATSLAVLILFAGILSWLAFYFMDRWWYHRLLYGAVSHGTFIENRMKTIFPEITLTEEIGKASPIRAFGQKIRTPVKIDIFYGTITAILVAITIITHFAVVKLPLTKTIPPNPDTSSLLSAPKPTGSTESKTNPANSSDKKDGSATDSVNKMKKQSEGSK